MNLKPTMLVLGAVLLIFTGVLGACGSRVYRQATAPRVDPEATLPPVTATASPTAPAQRLAQPHALSPADTAALRAAFAVLLPRTRLLTADDDTLLAYDRAAHTAAAQALLAAGYTWPPLESDFVFVYTALGPENAITCTAEDQCRLTQAVLGIQAVLILDETTCAGWGSAPCLTLLRDDQIDARDNLITADFQREPDGGWRLCGWEITPLPAPPAGW